MFTVSSPPTNITSRIDAIRGGGFGDIITAELLPSFQYTFAYGLPAILFDTSTQSGSGTAAGAGGLGVASTGATGSSRQKISTKRFLQYRAGFGGRIRFTAMFTGTPVAGSEMLVGLLTDTDGYAVGYVDDVFGFLHRNNSVDTFYPQTQWSGAGRTIDPSKLNIFEVVYQYLGAGHGILSVASPTTAAFEKAIATEYINRETTTNLSTPSLPFALDVSNSAGGEDLSVSCASVGAFSEGLGPVTGIHFAAGASAAGVGSATNIITVRSKATYNGVVNRIPVAMQQVSVGVEGTKPATLTIRKNATSGGTPSWADFNAESSMEYDTAGTWTGGRVVAVIGLSKSGSIHLDMAAWGLQLIAGETLTIEVTPASGTTDVTAGVTVKELR